MKLRKAGNIPAILFLPCRDAEINALVNSVNELATLFKQMNSIVIEQGTLIDRIDYNLQEAETFVDKGKKELVKVRLFGVL